MIRPTIGRRTMRRSHSASWISGFVEVRIPKAAMRKRMRWRRPRTGGSLKP
jgi:hypothetical protein